MQDGLASKVIRSRRCVEASTTELGNGLMAKSNVRYAHHDLLKESTFCSHTVALSILNLGLI